MKMLALVTFGKLIIGVLCVSLAVLVLIIAYRKMLVYLGKGNPQKENYCVLYSLEEYPSKGIIELYFTSEKTKEVAIQIFDENDILCAEPYNQKCEIGGTIVKFDSTLLKNGNYFYTLITENQKTMKKMTIANTGINGTDNLA